MYYSYSYKLTHRDLTANNNFLSRAQFFLGNYYTRYTNDTDVIVCSVRGEWSNSQPGPIRNIYQSSIPANVNRYLLLSSMLQVEYVTVFNPLCFLCYGVAQRLVSKRQSCDGHELPGSFYAYSPDVYFSVVVIDIINIAAVL